MAQIEPAKGGLRWVRSILSPGLNTPPTQERVVATNNATALFAGDGLKEGTDGCLLVAAAGEAISHVMVAAVRYKGSDGYIRSGAFLPATTTYTGTASKGNPLASIVLAIPVNGQVFEVDVPTANATATAGEALIGQCVDIVANAGSTVTGESAWTTDTVANFAATGNSAQLRLIGIPQYDQFGRINDVTKTYWKGHFLVYEQVGIL